MSQTSSRGAQERPRRPPEAPWRALGDHLEASKLEKSVFRRRSVARLAHEWLSGPFFIDFSLARECVEPHLDSPIPSRNEVRLFCEPVDPFERNSLQKEVKSMPRKPLKQGQIDLNRLLEPHRSDLERENSTWDGRGASP